MSLEEERARMAAQEAASTASATPALPTVSEGEATPLIKSEPLSTGAVIEDVDIGMAGDEDEDLARALAMSNGEDVDMDAAGGEEDDEEAEIARASKSKQIISQYICILIFELSTVAMSLKDDEDAK